MLCECTFPFSLFIAQLWPSTEIQFPLEILPIQGNSNKFQWKKCLFWVLSQTKLWCVWILINNASPLGLSQTSSVSPAVSYSRRQGLKKTNNGPVWQSRIWYGCEKCSHKRIRCYVWGRLHPRRETYLLFTHVYW